jgi:agmatinase
VANPQPRDASTSPRFAQVATFMRLPLAEDARGLDVALLGVPFDGGVSYRPGPRFGPQEIREHSRLIRPYNPALGVNPFEVLRIADVGDVDVNPLNIEDTHARMERALEPIYAAGAIPICVGGDHSISLAALRAAAGTHGPVGMVHIDSHQDMWDTYFGTRYYHGAPFRRALEEGCLDGRRVLQIGIRGPVYGPDDFAFAREHGVRVIRGEEVARQGIEWVKTQVGVVHGGPVYLSFDIDGVDPAFAPGTGTPEVGGLTSREALELVRALAGLHLVAADLVEVSPPYDHAGVTALLAANVLFEMVSVMALTRQRTSRRKGS